MRTWDLALDLSIQSLRASGSQVPLYKQIAQVIAHDIERGRMKLGERLPATRSLAAELGVNRNTIVAAFDVLRTEGWITGRTTSGTFVAERRHEQRPIHENGARVPGFDLPPQQPVNRPIHRTPGLKLLLGGVPELRSVPHRELARAYAAALRGNKGRKLLDYADPQGNERLRTGLGEMLARTRGVQTSAEAICVVRGSQQALYLVARALIKPGDLVAIEGLGYPPLWEILRSVGAEVAPIAVDADGIDVEALENLCHARTVRALVVTPQHQYPTTVTLSSPRRQRLLALAARHRLMVVEDDYDYDYHYDGPPVLPLASADTAGVVVYIATLSKSIAPGLRLGYVSAAPQVIEHVTSYRSWLDQQGDHVLEQAIALLLEDGALQRHVRRVRRIYHARRDVLCEALQRHLPDLVFTSPAGGMALWARAPGIDTRVWVQRALEAGVAFQSGTRFIFGGEDSDYVRIGFAACDEREIEDAVRIMAATCPEAS